MNLSQNTSYTYNIYKAGGNSVLNTITITTPVKPAIPSAISVAGVGNTFNNACSINCNYNGSIVAVYSGSNNSSNVYLYNPVVNGNNNFVAKSISPLSGYLIPTMNYMGNFIYAVWNKTCVYSMDGGSTWTSKAVTSPYNINNSSHMGIKCNYLGDKIYVSTPVNPYCYILYSSDYGITYTTLITFNEYSSGCITATPDFSKAFWGTNSYYCFNTSGSPTNVSSIYGMSQIKGSNSGSFSYFESVGIDPSSGTFYVIPLSNNASTPLGLCKSTNGTTWTNASNTTITNVQWYVTCTAGCVNINADLICATVTDGSKFYALHSSNQGTSWVIDISYSGTAGYMFHGTSYDGSVVYFCDEMTGSSNYQKVLKLS